MFGGKARDKMLQNIHLCHAGNQFQVFQVEKSVLHHAEACEEKKH